MKLNTRMRYGTRAMLELALDYREGPTSIREIADRQGLSAKYLEQLLSALQRAGFVTAVRGSQGGYRLSRPPDQISLREIYDVFEGPGGFVPCVPDPSACERSVFCVTRGTWVQMYEASTEVLGATTLADLVQRIPQKWTSAPMYQI